MKTYEIKDILKKDLLVVELQTDVINSSYHIQKTPKGILIKDDTGEKFISNKCTLLGKPDEISEEDAEGLVEGTDFKGFNLYWDYINERWFDESMGATESLLSLIESEIFWENPIPKPENYNLWEKYGDYTQYGVRLTKECKKWHEAKKKTFDRNRSLIFKKN